MKKITLLLFTSMACLAADRYLPVQQLSTLIHQSNPRSSKLSDIEKLLDRNPNLSVKEQIELLKKEESCCDTTCNSVGNGCCCCGLTLGCGILFGTALTQCVGTLPPEYASFFMFPAGAAIAAGFFVKEAIDTIAIPKYHLRKKLEDHQRKIEPQALSQTNLRQRKQRQIYESLV